MRSDAQRVGRTALVALTCVVGMAAPHPTAARIRAHTAVVEVSPGRKLFYREVGHGPTVILVHGAFMDYECWSRTANALSAHARVIAVSRYGHYPDSTSNDSLHYTFEQNATDLLDFIRVLKLGRVHLVGHSYGGVVAILAATRAPSEVRSLTLVEPYAVSLIADSSSRRALVERRKEVLGRVASAATPELRVRLLVGGIVGSDGALDSLKQEQLSMLYRNARTAPWLNKPQPTLSCPALDQFKGNALLVLGGSSTEVFREIGDGWMKCVPRTRRVTIPGAGHFVMWDRPDELARVLAAFVSGAKR